MRESINADRGTLPAVHKTSAMAIFRRKMLTAGDMSVAMHRQHHDHNANTFSAVFAASGNY
jgi:hypothetical protein